MITAHRLLLTAVCALCATTAYAQKHIDVPRPDGHTTPLLVYAASPQPTATCAPLALLSHGLGGSERGLSYLASFMTTLGYTAVVMGHQESGLNAVKQQLKNGPFRDGIRGILEDPAAESARLLDITAALNWSDKTCKPPSRILLGHSMGAVTVMLEAGAANKLTIASPPAGLSRFDAFVALSPEGPGGVFPEHAWTEIRKPILILTGTLDGAAYGGPPSRLIPFRELPATSNNCAWQGVIDGATHNNFAGNGEGHERAEPLITTTVKSFLSHLPKGPCTLPAPQPGLKLQAK